MAGVSVEVQAWRREKVREHTRTGMSAAEIAIRLGVSARTVQRIRDELGISRGRAPFLTAEQLAVADRLLSEGCSFREAARTVGCSESAVAGRFPGRGWTFQQSGAWAAWVRKVGV